MRRREFIAAALTAAGGPTFTRTPMTAHGQPRQRRPNILFIMTDQQHAGMMSCTGNKWLKTPAMDRLAASGIRFEKSYACNPVCVPSRFSLQTGLMPSAIGMSHNGDLGRAAVTEIMLQQSLGSLFQKAGYETVYGGKVHLPARMDNLRNIGYRNLTNDSRQGLANACVEFIKSPHASPFLLFASFMNPHDICYMAINAHARANGQPPADTAGSKTCEAVLDRVRGAGDLANFVRNNCPPLPSNHGIPENEPGCITHKYVDASAFRAHVRANWSEDQWRLHRWAYCRLTEMVDEQIGILLDAVREAGLEDNTLIVFTSDHGDMDASHRLEHKSVLYEEAVRVPFVMSLGGVIPRGVVDDLHLVSNGLDLLPTLCDFAEIETPAGLLGRSLRPLTQNRPVEGWRDFVVSESQNARMLRTDRFKYCIYDSGERREQLVDLKDDPGEMKNLVEAPGVENVLDRHRRLLKNWVRRTGDRIGATYT